MNTRQTFAIVIGAITVMACSQCTPSNDTNQNGDATPPIHGDAGVDSESIDALPDADATPPTTEWLPVQGLEMCDGKSLNLAVSSWPSRTWTSCGSGCLIAPGVHLPDAGLAGKSHSGAATIRGDTYVRTSMYAAPYRYYELRRMSDDAVLFVLRFQSGCYTSSQKNGSPLLFEVSEGGQPEDGTIEHWIATFSLADMQLHVHPGLVSTSPYIMQWLTWNEAWGVLHAAKFDVALNPQEAALTTIHQGGFPGYARAHEDLVAWVDWGYWPTPIRSYTVKDGMKTLVQGNWGAVGLGIGDERIAWVTVLGPYAGDGAYESATLSWTPRTTDPNAVQITDGPSLTGKFTGGPEIGTVGDYIALTVGGDGITGASSGTYVLQVSTGKFWFIQAPPDTYITLAALGKSEIIVMETAFKTNPNYFENYRRYELSKLDELGEQIAP